MRYASRVSFRPQTKCAMEGLVSARRGFCRAVRASHACPTFPQGREKGADTERSCGGALGAASVHVGPSQDGDLHLLGRRPPLVSHLLLVLG